MKKLTSQTWEIYGKDEDDEKITIEFETFKNEVTLSIHKGDKMITFEHDQIHELKNVIESTKFIFNQ